MRFSCVHTTLQLSPRSCQVCHPLCEHWHLFTAQCLCVTPEVLLVPSFCTWLLPSCLNITINVFPFAYEMHIACQKWKISQLQLLHSSSHSKFVHREQVQTLILSFLPHFPYFYRSPSLSESQPWFSTIVFNLFIIQTPPKTSNMNFTLYKSHPSLLLKLFREQGKLSF